MSKNVCDEVIPPQTTDKIEAKFANPIEEGEIYNYIKEVKNSLVAIPREYGRTLEILQKIDKLIRDPEVYFVKDDLYKSVNSMSKDVKQDIKKELKKDKTIVHSHLNNTDPKEVILSLTYKLDAISQLSTTVVD